MNQQKVGIGVYRRLLSYLRPYRLQFSCAFVAMIIYGATDGLIPVFIKYILDEIFGQHSENMLYLLPAVIVVFAVVRGVFGFLQHYLAASVGHFIVRDLRNAINQKLLILSPSFFGRYTSGSLVSRMTNDTLFVRTALTDAVRAVLRDSTRIVALLATALYLDPLLAVIALVGFPLGIYPVIRFGKRIKKLGKQGQDEFGGLTSILQESLLGHLMIRVFRLEDAVRKRFEKENERLTRTFRKAEKYAALSGPTNEFIGSLAIALVILYGGISVLSGTRTQGDFIAFITTMFLLYEPVKKLSRVNSVIQLGIAAAERIFELLDQIPDVQDKESAVILPATVSPISFEKVSFWYPKRASEEGGADVAPALSDVSLKIGAGQTLALVGMSGGGKTTIANLLLRFFEPQSGQIKIGGTNINDYTLASLRENIALVSQHTFLFNDTVYNNIAFGRLSASREEVLAAAEAAQASSFISRLPGGFETIVGEQGYSLSGGERARLAIARALLKDAPILILDEATASLDSESEKAVQEGIARLQHGRTVLVIAHRLATVRKADCIAVLVRGQVRELGTHEELLGQGGEYSKLCRLQFQGDSVEPERYVLP